MSKDVVVTNNTKRRLPLGGTVVLEPHETVMIPAADRRIVERPIFKSYEEGGDITVERPEDRGVAKDGKQPLTT